MSVSSFLPWWFAILCASQVSSFSHSRYMSRDNLDSQVAAAFKKISNRGNNRPNNFSIESALPYIQSELTALETQMAKMREHSGPNSEDRLQLDPETALKVAAASDVIRRQIGSRWSEMEDQILQDKLIAPLLFDSIRRNSTFLSAYWIYRGARLNAVDPQSGHNVIHLSIVHNLKSIVRLIIQKDKDTAHQNKNVLHLIARHGKGDWVEVAELLALNNVPINDLDDQKQTPLHVAVQYNRIFLLEFLIRNKANINAVDVDGTSVLHLAVPNYLITRLLIKLGADYNCRNHFGRTPLHLAALSNHLRSAKILVSNEASILAQDNFSRSSLSYAEQFHSREEIFRFLNYEASFENSS